MNLVQQGYKEYLVNSLFNSNTRILEKGKGPVILMVSGWLGTAENFVPIIDILSSQYRCLSIDLPGFGKSKEFRNHIMHNLHNYSLYINDLINRLKLKNTVYLGISYGASLGLNIIGKNMNIKMGIIQSPVYKPLPYLDKSSQLSLNAIHQFPDVLKLIIKLSKYNIIKNIAYILGDGNIKSLSLHSFKEYGLSSFHKSSTRAIRESISDLLSCDISEQIRLIKKPILLIYGSRELLFSNEYEYTLRDMIPMCSFQIIQDGSHFAVLQKYQVFSSITNSFIRTNI